jgi:cell wall-associated NlpC family hydrolase
MACTKSGLPKISYAQLEGAWIAAGGPPANAPTMAAIAMAESGGTPQCVQAGENYANTGWGCWQITPGDSVPEVGVNAALLNPITNAKAAFSKFKSQGLEAWTTFTSGRYLPFLQTGVQATTEGLGSSAVASSADEKIATAITYAQAQIGKQYSETQDGGVGPDYFDCSGLCMMAYRAAGVTIPRNTYGQIAGITTHVSTDQSAWLPGDLIYGVPFPGDQHVVMYIGGGQIIQAPHTGATVFQSSLADGFPYTPIAVRRPVPGGTAAGVTAAGAGTAGSSSSSSSSGDCLIKFPGVLGAGSFCILGKSDADKLLGGVLIGAAGILVIAGLAICAVGAGLKVKVPGPVGALTGKGGGSGSGDAAPDDSSSRHSSQQIPLSAYPSTVPSRSTDENIF